MTIEQILSTLVLIFGSGGIIAAYISLRKVRPEVGQIFVTTAKTAVEAQDRVIENQTSEIKRLTEEVSAMRVIINEMKGQIEVLIRENSDLKEEIIKLNRRR